MTLAELEATLPNGLHDSECAELRIDFAARTARMSLSVWVGEDDEPEARRSGVLELTGLQFLSIDPPENGYPFNSAKPLWLSECVDPPKSIQLPAPLEKTAFVASFFVNEWNAFIHVSALSASLTWQGGD